VKAPIRVVVICLLACSLLLGQVVSSSIRGALVDPTGAAIPGAQCTLTNQTTGAVLKATSSADGSFVFPNVLPGTYTLKIEATGFKTLETKDIVVTANQVRALGNITLQLGEVRETVSVAAEAAAIQLASAEKSGTITGDQIQNIAVKGRDFFALLLTVPGVVDNFSQRRETLSPDSIRGTFINGGRENQKNLAVDGITDLDTGSNSTVHFQPNMDAIAEIKIMTSNYQAEFGRSGGGVITVITKSGTRDFHGTAYNFYRHESLNANNFFNNRTGTPKSPYRYRISGFSIGGPIYVPKKFNTDRDKLFFFFSQEYIGMKRDYGTRFVNTPTALEREGNFSDSRDVNGALIPVRDPLTGQPFPGNIIPKDRINKLGQAILNFFPLPNYTDPDPRLVYQRNYRSAYSGSYPKRQDVIRIDSNIWPSLRAYWRYIKDKDEQDTPYGMWVNGAINYYLTPVRFGQPGKGQVVHITKTFSPTLVNEFIFGKSRNNLYFDPVDKSLVDRSKMGNPPQWFRDQAGPRTYLPAASANHAPNIAFGGQPANPIAFGLGNVPYLNYNDIYSFVNNVSKVWGPHNFKAGIYIERTGKFQVGGGNWRGAFSFSRDTNNPFDSNHSFANALLGNITSYSEATARVDGDWWFWNVEWFVQDNWRVNRRLTLDVGIRFYHQPPMEDLNRTISTWDPNYYDIKKAPALYMPARDPQGRRVAQDPISKAFAPQPMIGLFVPGSGDPANGMKVGGVDGYPPGLYTTSWLHFGPRFGFAFDLFGNGKTALRGGFGMFKDRPQGNPTFYANGNPPVAYTPTLFYGNLDSYAGAGGAIGPTNLLTLLGHNKHATTMNYSFGIQHQIWSTTIDVSYVGTLGRHLIIRRNLNPIPMYARFDPANQDPTQPGRPLPDNFLRPIKGYGDINLQEFAATSNYNSLQVAANRRYTRGLQFGVAYTFSKTLGIVGDDYSSISPYFSPRKRNYGPLAWHRPHVFVLNYIWDLPKVGQRLGVKPLGWILDHWQVSGMTTFMTGAPFTPGFSTTDGMDITGSSEGARITVVGNPRLKKSEKTFYRNFNTDVFRRTPQRDFGNSGLNYLHGPGVNNWDIAVSKRVPLFSEERFIQFRTEMFNAWNHTQFSSLDATFRFDPQGVNQNPNVGAFTGARDARIIQLSLKLYF
jgi:hypothetical protein